MTVLYVAGMAVFWLLLMVAVVAFFAGCQATRDRQVTAALEELLRAELRNTP